MLTQEQFLTAMTIISAYHSTKIVINRPKADGFVDGNSINVKLEITNCVAGLINKLKENGYSLSLNNGYLSVLKY